MNNTITVTQLSLSPVQDLMEDVEQRLQKIDSIKGEICEEWDNINNPVPFITEQAPVFEMADEQI